MRLEIRTLPYREGNVVPPTALLELLDALLRHEERVADGHRRSVAGVCGFGMLLTTGVELAHAVREERLAPAQVELLVAGHAHVDETMVVSVEAFPTDDGAAALTQDHGAGVAKF